MVSTVEELSLSCRQYEELEFNVQNEDSKSEIYLNLLAIYILQNDLVNGKFLWKRIPENFKACCPHLGLLWHVGQLLWQRDFPSVYIALDQEWPEVVVKYIRLIREMLQERAVKRVSKAYSNIRVDEFSKQLGVNEEEAKKVALKHGWQLDEDGIFIHPKNPSMVHQPTADSAITSEQQLAYLTDYISYLEN